MFDVVEVSIAELRAALEAGAVTIDARPIFAGGGGIHCITQQQPSVTEA